ncbi:MAG: AraC family transcriptional regulator [Alkalispirochaeta sp.]
MQIDDVVFVYQLKSPELVRWHSRRHSHPAPQYEVHYFLSGDGRFENGGSRYRLGHGELFLTPPEMVHAVETGELHRPVSYYAVLFSLEPENPLRGFLDAPGFVETFPRHVGSRHRVLFEELTNRFAHASGARHSAGMHMLQALLWDLAAETGGLARAGGAAADTGGITRAGGETAGRPAGSGGGAARADRAARTAPERSDNLEYNIHVDRAVQLFERHIAEPITVKAVARTLEISQEHLTRLFDRRFGVSPLQYYRRLRMEVAASRLINSTASVKEIAWELGYSNPFHFSRSFKQFAELSPVEYRRQYYRNTPTRYAAKVVERNAEPPRADPHGERQQ